MNDPHLAAGELSYPAEFRTAATELVQQSSRIVRIFSPELANDIYADENFVKALSAMVRSTKRAEAKIIVMPGASLASRSHGLLTLCRQLPTVSHIRVLHERPDRFLEDYVISDSQGLLTRKAQHDNRAWYDPNDRIETLERIEHFDHLWHRAQESAELRRLSL